jgi:hypothetical protein
MGNKKVKGIKKIKKDKPIVKFYDGKSGDKYPITFELKDGTLMVNATQMGKAFGETKRPVFFLRAKGTMAFINEMKRSADYNFGNHDLPYVIVKGGSRLIKQGTWMHEKLALKYAAWIAPRFENWVYENILELLKTGKVELDRPSVMEMDEHFNPQNQRNNSLEVAKEIYRQSKGDVASIPKYYYDLTMKLTGCSPKEWVKMGKQNGLKKEYTSKGGREVMRQLSPKFTVAMSFADNILSSEKHLTIKNDLQYVVDAVKKGIPMFDELLKLGVKPPELKGTKALF